MAAAGRIDAKVSMRMRHPCAYTARATRKETGHPVWPDRGAVVAASESGVGAGRHGALVRSAGQRARARRAAGRGGHLPGRSVGRWLVFGDCSRCCAQSTVASRWLLDPCVWSHAIWRRADSHRWRMRVAICSPPCRTSGRRRRGRSQTRRVSSRMWTRTSATCARTCWGTRRSERLPCVRWRRCAQLCFAHAAAAAAAAGSRCSSSTSSLRRSATTWTW